MEPRSSKSSTGPGVAHSIRVEPSRGVSRIPASLSVPSSVPSANSAIMSSLASFASEGHYDHSLNSLTSFQSNAAPDILSTEMRSVDLGPVNKECFKIINEAEELQVQNASDLLKRMGVAKQNNLQVKVVSIFGNTGEGKSYTLNQIFFKGAEVFKTSSSQTSCTLGIWGAYDSTSKALILDTEGLLGISNISKQRKRLLLKVNPPLSHHTLMPSLTSSVNLLVLAVSDVIIYRTRAERLNTDMYKFLAEASRAYTK
ncbi:Zinc finger FYVE domain-containing protein 1 [Halocaridina rubra]|uniref:Zinc finger FYVE domain-containing protein 1 n=1 Tax=Halocaridina rubra TaxID=373956 RepID=A0AAN8WXR5_HALRR